MIIHTHQIMHSVGKIMTFFSSLFQDALTARVPGGRRRAGEPVRRPLVRQARLPGLRQPRDPQVQYPVLRTLRRHVGSRGHALHHDGRKVSFHEKKFVRRL